MILPYKGAQPDNTKSIAYLQVDDRFLAISGDAERPLSHFFEQIRDLAPPYKVLLTQEGLILPEVDALDRLVPRLNSGELSPSNLSKTVEAVLHSRE